MFNKRNKEKIFFKGKEIEILSRINSDNYLVRMRDTHEKLYLHRNEIDTSQKN